VLDIKDLRVRPENYRDGLLKRGLEPIVIDQILEVDAQRRRTQAQLENLLAIRKLEAEVYHLDMRIGRDEERIASIEGELLEMVRE
jgi:seryl-tRNA synthetase